MQNDKKNKSAQITDEALDEMLAQWAEAEIEPPADFHARTMERLRKEQQKTEKKAVKRKENVVPFFARSKKWISAAAAAVLVLCCIPVVQAQMGDNNHNVAYDALPNQAQVASNNDSNAEDSNIVANHNAEQKDSLKNDKDSSNAEKAQNDAVTQQAAGDKISKGGDVTQQNPVQTGSVNAAQPEVAAEPQPAATDENSDGQLPAVAAFSLEDEPTDTAQNGKQVRDVNDNLQQVADKVASYEDALTELTTKLEEVQKELEKADAKLKAEPENTELQENVKDLQEHIDTLKKEIEQMKKLIEEAKAE